MPVMVCRLHCDECFRIVIDIPLESKVDVKYTSSLSVCAGSTGPELLAKSHEIAHMLSVDIGNHC